MTESVGRKLNDLRVTDLRDELEKRKLEVSGTKTILLERLQKALKDEGKDPEKYLFSPLERRNSVNVNKKTPKKGSNEGDQEKNENGDANDLLVDEVGTVDNEEFDENVDDTHDTSNNDNEESINLTIEEEEQKLLHEQAQDEKEKQLPTVKIKQEIIDVDEDIGAETEEPIKNETVKNENETSNKEEKNTNKDADDKDDKVSKEKNTKKDDSEQKSSSKASAGKDEKEKTTSDSKSKSATTVSPSSRNLWVSGLSSLTRASDLKTIFSKYGKVIGAKVVTNTRTPGTRCYGYVTMSSSADATKCIEHLHRTELHGRIISVERTKNEIVSSSSATKKKENEKKSISRDRKLKPDEKEKKDKEKEKEKEKEKDKSKEKKPIAENGEEQKDAETGSGEVEKAKSEVSSKRDKRTSRSADRRRADRPRHNTDRERERQREILSFQKIREERERQRLRERERELREEERRRREIRRRQREEEDRLAREREKLALERERLEREKAELLRLERERQKLEREKIELERLELKRQQMKNRIMQQNTRIEETTKRPLKRPADERYVEPTDRKRSAPMVDRRVEAPPPPRFDASLATRNKLFRPSYERPVEKKRDDYSSTKREDYVSSKREEYASAKRDDFVSKRDDFVSKREDFVSKRDDFVGKRDDFVSKRDDYVASKRDDYKRDIAVPTRHSSSYHGRDAVTSHKPARFAEPEPRSNFRRTDDRDTSFSKKKPISELKSHGTQDYKIQLGSALTIPINSFRNPSSNKRYEVSSYTSDRGASGGGWQGSSHVPHIHSNHSNHGGGAPPMKSFVGNGMQSSINVPSWQSKSSEGHWRPVESQDRYDRTYNERSGPFIEPARPGMYVSSRPQDRYAGPMSSRYEAKY